MQIIGITGGIGSGKSTIARALAARGYAVYDCDKEAKRIIAENEEVQQKIIELLGEEAFVEVPSNQEPSTKVYNTAYVASRVFANPELLERLNQIVHPAVKKDILHQLREKRSLSTFDFRLSTLFIESAILYEAGLDELCDRIIIVDAPEDIRIARTIARDYHGDATPENINKVRARIRAQHPIPFTSPLSPFTFHLTNDGSVSISDLADTILNWLQKS